MNKEYVFNLNPENLGEMWIWNSESTFAYVLDLRSGACDCPGYKYRGHCKHWELAKSAYNPALVELAGFLADVSRIFEIKEDPNA